MSDTHDTTIIPAPEVHADPPHDPFMAPEPVVEEKTTAVMRLREFEDKHFGKSAVRINGRIERGYGSQFKQMPAELQAEYAALEKLVEAEQKLEDATTAVFTAKVARDAAEADVERAAMVADQKAAEAAEAADQAAA